MKAQRMEAQWDLDSAPYGNTQPQSLAHAFGASCYLHCITTYLILRGFMALLSGSHKLQGICPVPAQNN